MVIEMGNLENVVKETLGEMKKRQSEIVFVIKTRDERIKKRKEALSYVMCQLEYMDSIIRLGY